MSLNCGLHLQPLLLVRTSPDVPGRTAADLQFGGYVVTIAESNDFALWMANALPADGLVVDVGFHETLAIVARARDLELPTLVVSGSADALRRVIPYARVVQRGLPRHELIAAMDRVLVDALARHDSSYSPIAPQPLETLSA